MDLTRPENAKSPEQGQLFDDPPVLVLLERAGKIVFASDQARQLLGLTAGDWIPRPIEDLIWGLPNTLWDSRGSAEGQHGSTAFNATLPARNGRLYPLVGTYTITQQNPREAVIVAHPVDSHRDFKARLADDVLASLPEAIVVERNNQILYINPAFTRMFGYSDDETRGRSILQLIVPETRLNEHISLQKAVREQGRNASETVRVHKSGELMDVSLQVSPLVSGSTLVGYVHSFRDIGERKEAEARLQHDAMHDVLTGLPNRALFQDRLTLALSRRARRPDQSCGVLYLDLDRFKEINDGLGHAAGDVLLQDVAERFANVLRPQDSAARLGGDEFAVLVENIVSAADLEIVGSRILKELERPFEIFGHLIRVGSSIGAAMAGPDHTSAELLIRDADLAMYRAKQTGGSRIEIYDRHLEVSVSSQQERERELRTILERRLFDLWYEPIFRLTDGKLEGFEVSLSWKRADGAMENSRDLLDVAEETGFAIILAREMLEAACLQLRQWSDMLPQSDFYLGVNLTERMFFHDELVAQLGRALALSGVDPMRMIVEVGEDALNQNPDAAVVILQRIVDCGVRVALDNFGNGLAPLNHLVRLPLDVVKLDGNLALAVDTPGRQQALLDTLIRLSKIIGLQVVAQGIMTAEQLDALLQMGCFAGQGPMLSGPVDATRAFRIAQPRPGPVASRL